MIIARVGFKDIMGLGTWYISVIFQTIRRGGLLKDSSFGRIFLSHSWADLSRFEGTTSPCHSYILQIWHRPCRMGLWILSHPLSRRRFQGGVLIHAGWCWSKQIFYVLKMMMRRITFIFLGWWRKLLSGNPTWQCYQPHATSLNLYSIRTRRYLSTQNGACQCHIKVINPPIATWICH